MKGDRMKSYSWLLSGNGKIGYLIINDSYSGGTAFRTMMRITIVNAIQIIGVRIWHIFVHGCLDCKATFLRNRALNCFEFFFWRSFGFSFDSSEFLPKLYAGSIL